MYALSRIIMTFFKVLQKILLYFIVFINFSILFINIKGILKVFLKWGHIKYI